MITLKHQNLEDLLVDPEEQQRVKLDLIERQRLADANMAPRRDEQ